MKSLTRQGENVGTLARISSFSKDKVTLGNAGALCLTGGTDAFPNHREAHRWTVCVRQRMGGDSAHRPSKEC